MRLLNARTYELHTELEQNKPQYAILSHTWEEEEVLFEDIQRTLDAAWKTKKGFSKIEYTCEQALQDGYDFVWIDTCCINKDSSAELSEAINSMFKWYQEATICYTYLSDTNSGNGTTLSQCRWFGRGWTLQELIAPDHVHFYDKTWAYIGSRISLSSELSKLTGIQVTLLTRGHRDQKPPTNYNYSSPWCRYCSCPGTAIQNELSHTSVAQRMKWASKRVTTRVEDIAYCLMGLFDVNMPLLYGEGTKAFRRLQKEIVRRSRDHSIFAFRAPDYTLPFNDVYSFLAPHPSFFRDDIQNEWMPAAKNTDILLSNEEVSVDMLICPVCIRDAFSLELEGDYIGILDSVIGPDYLCRPAILLTRLDESDDRFYSGSRVPVLLLLEPGEKQYCKILKRTTEEHIRRVRYNPEEITRRRIIIMDRNALQPSYSRYVPLRLNVSSAVSSMFDSYAATPRFISGYTLITPTDDCGMIFFYSNTIEDFLVAWDDSSNPQEGPVSRGIWPLTAVEDNDILELASQPQEKLEGTKIWMFLNSCTARRRRHARNEVVLGEQHTTQVRIWVSVSKVTFIGRTVFQLNIDGKLLSKQTALVSHLTEVTESSTD